MANNGVVLPPVVRRTSRSSALALASFGALLAFLDVTIVNIAFPDIQKTFHNVSIDTLSWVLNSYNIVFAALLVAAGRLADVFGRRRTFKTGLFVFTAASALCAAAPDVGVLIGARMLQAVGAGLLVPASLALVVEAFPIERRAHAVGIWGATAAFAAGIGPPLGGALVDVDSWRLAFLINVPFGLVALAITGRALVESRAPGRRRLPDLRGATLLAGSVALITLGIIEGPTWGWSSAGVVLAFVLAPLLGLGVVWSSRQHPAPVLDPALLRVPTFSVANVLTFVAGIGFYAYMLNNILWLHYVWHWSFLRSGLGVAPGAIVAAVVAASLGPVADRRGHRAVVVSGAIVWTAAYIWYLTMVDTRPDFFGEWLPGQVLSGIGVGATLPIVAAAALEAVPGARYATASAIVSSTRQLGAVLGISLLVVIVGQGSSIPTASAFRHGWILSIACFGAAAVIGLALRRQHAVAAEEVPAPAAGEVHIRTEEFAEPEAALGRASVLAELPIAARQRLLSASPVVTVEGGRWLFRAGDAADAMYVVRSGRLDVIGEQGVIRELGAGDVVGELALLTGTPRSAGVRARRDSVLWQVTPARFDATIRRDTKLMRALTVSLARQVQSNQDGATDNVVRQPRVIAVVGIGDGAPVVDVANRIREQMVRYLDVHMPKSISAEGLHRAEPQHDRILLVADDPAKRWHAFCLRQADRVVVVAASGSEPPAGWQQRIHDGYVLLIGAPPGSRLRVNWRESAGARHVFVGTGDAADAVRNIAARLGGRSIGVAIAGGGARSLSAIGVVEQLADAGFHIDRLAGCSVGGAVAALFATGRDATAVDAACYDEFVRRNPFNDYHLPTVSLARGHKLEEAITRQFGDVVFEGLPRELTLVSTDLLNRELVVHRTGRVGLAVRASLSLPGLYPPVLLGGSLLVDGGVLDNLPVRPLTDFDEGPVVAINIGAAASMRSSSGPVRTPSLGETLLRTMLMAGTSTLTDAKQRAAVVVTPDTRGIGLLEFHQMDRARDAGRAAGAAAVDALRQHLASTTAVPQQRVHADTVLDLRDAADVARTVTANRRARR